MWKIPVYTTKAKGKGKNTKHWYLNPSTLVRIKL